MKPRIIAFYLPQFHPTSENDEWWGKGFTEWTNVGKARPLFKGHYQPRVPADLGYYDLRIPQVREEQTKLAREAGVYGFCYWHYWFDQNRQILEDIFDEVLNTNTPDFPFCLGWANHSWYAKTWNKDIPDKLLCEQKYLGKEDYEAHFQYALKAFSDKRYIRVNDCPLFYVFDPIGLPDDFIPYWNQRAKQSGLKKIYFVAKMSKDEDEEMLLSKGFDALVPERMAEAYTHNPLWIRLMVRFIRLFSSRPKYCFSYKYASKFFINDKDKNEYVMPQIIPQWDHSPRSGNRKVILHNSTPELFANHAARAFEAVKGKKNPIVFLKSWNEWAEGNYMEPDLKFGKGYINALHKALEQFE